MEDLAQWVPPQNVEAEQSVLGAMLLDRDAARRCLELLREEDFYREAHRRIFQAIVALVDRGEPADVITVGEELRRTGQLELVGGGAYLTDLAASVPTSANAGYYARIVADKSLLRRLLAVVNDIARQVYEAADEPEVLLDQAESAIFRIAEERRHNRPYAALRDVLVEAFEQIEYLYEHKGDVLGVPTGLKDLDRMTTGFHPAEFVVLAARPSQGKTTLSLNIAAHAAQQGVPVGVFSLEMSRDQVAQRLLCAEARVSLQRLRTGFLTDQDWPRLSRALGRLSEAPIFIDDTPNISIMELRARARRMRAEHQVGLLVIDYLQLMHTRGRAESRQQEIAEISRSLKALARELQVPVLALSQLSRAVELRETRRPQLSDLRESGSIEQDADVVVFIHQEPEASRDPARQAEYQLIVAKQRNGPTGVVPVVFLREIGRFEDIATKAG
jgi:replicative DNA helicase